MPTLRHPSSKLCAHIDFSEGSLCLSTFPFDGHEARITTWDNIIQQLSGGEDSLTLTIENSSMHGRRVSEYWSFSSPPEGSNVKIYDNLDNGEKVLLFWGTINEIESVTEGFVTLHVRSLDAKLDEVLGEPITLDDYPDAAEEAVGRRKPRVYGTFNRFKPPLVDDNVMTKLDTAILDSDTTIGVEDVSEFDDSGSIRIDDEIIAYTGRNTTTDEFTGCSRGQEGTEAESHVTGADVYEHGDLVYLVDEDAGGIDTIDGVKLVNSDGIAIPAPAAWYTVDTSGPSTITFDRVPTVPVASEGTFFKDIDCDREVSPAPSNPADNADRACGAHANWTEFNYATIDKDASKLNLHIGRFDSDIDHPNSYIKRAFLVVEHYVVPSADPTNVDVTLDSDLLGTLTASTNTPKDIQEDDSIHRESKGFQDAHTHALQNDPHSHELEGMKYTPTWSEQAVGSYGYAFDDNADTNYWLDKNNSNRNSIRFRWISNCPYADASLDKVRVRFLHGYQTGGLVPNVEAQGVWVDLKIKNTSIFTNKTINPSGGTKAIATLDDSGSPYDVSGYGWTVDDLYDTNSYIQVDIKTAGGNYFLIWEVWIELWMTTSSESAGPTDSQTPLETSSYTWFDITDKLSGADDDAKWQSLKDKVIKIEDGGLGSGEKVYVLRAFYAVEFQHATAENTKTVLCNVEGHLPAGNAALILSDIAQNLVGLSTANMDTAAFTDVYNNCTDGFGGALEEFETGRELFTRLGEQFRISLHWQAGKLTPVLKPSISSISTPILIASEDDIQKGTLSISRYPLSELYNKVTVNYKKSYLRETFMRSVVRESATSQSLYGRTGAYLIDADFVLEDSEAQALGDQIVEYKGWGVDVIECVLTKDWNHLERGDIIGFSHRLGSWAKCEILEVELRPAKAGVVSGVRVIAVERRTG